VGEDVAERVYEFVVEEEYKVVDEVGDGGPGTPVVVGKGIQFVSLKTTDSPCVSFLLSLAWIYVYRTMTPIIRFPRNDIRIGTCCCYCGASSRAPRTGLAELTVGKRNAQPPIIWTRIILLSESFRVPKLKLRISFYSITYNGWVVVRNRILDYLSVFYVYITNADLSPSTIASLTFNFHPIYRMVAGVCG